MAINSRQKGKRLEREAAQWWCEHGFECRRGQQHKGGPDSPDVVGVPGLHLEVKSRKRIANLYQWLQQANEETAMECCPIVMAKANGKPWVFLLDEGTFLGIYEGWLKHHESKA